MTLDKPDKSMDFGFPTIRALDTQSFIAAIGMACAAALAEDRDAALANFREADDFWGEIRDYEELCLSGDDLTKCWQLLERTRKLVRKRIGEVASNA